MYKTKMFPIKCNQSWNKKIDNLQCRWCSVIKNETPTINNENEYHIMGSCKQILLKHGGNILTMIPNLNEATPFVCNTKQQWKALGKFLDSINKEIQLQNTTDDVPSNPLHSTANKRKDGL